MAMSSVQRPFQARQHQRQHQHHNWSHPTCICNSEIIYYWHVTFASKFLLFCMCYQKSKLISEYQYQIWIFGSVKLNSIITTEIWKNISVKNALISAPEKLLLHCLIPYITHVYGVPKNITLKYTLCGPFMDHLLCRCGNFAIVQHQPLGIRDFITSISVLVLKWSPFVKAFNFCFITWFFFLCLFVSLFIYLLIDWFIYLFI